MRDRAGTVLYWLGAASAVLILAFGMFVAIRLVVGILRGADVPRPYLLGFSMIVGGTAIAAAVPWLIGLACRLFLCTNTPHLRASTYTEIARVGSGLFRVWLVWTAIVAASAVRNGMQALGIAFLMLWFLQFFGDISERYVAPALRRWANAAPS